MPSIHESLFPRITVGVATYKRAAVLRQMLVGLVRQDYPAGRLELLVIDNNSPDNTREVVAEFSTSSTNSPHTVGYIHEAQQGLDHARNRAIAEARGDLLVLADDDILMEPDWVRTLCAPLITEWQQGRETIGCAAGEVVPIFPDGCPDWIRDWHGPQGFRSAAEGSGPLLKTAYPMGANFAFPRWVFERVGHFATGLDRQGASLFGGGDRELLRRIHEAGYAVWFVPTASVLHQMPASRTTFRYAARHAFDSARSRVVERTRLGDSKCTGLGGKCLYLLSRFFGSAVKALAFALLALCAALLFQRGTAKKALVRAWRCCGYLYQIPRSLFGRV